jgi:Domain of unknown function (DUF5667)
MMGWGGARRRVSCEDLYYSEPAEVDLLTGLSPEESPLAAAIQRAGLSLPASERTGEMRGALMEQATAARDTGRSGAVRAGGPAGARTRLRPLPTFAMTAAAMALVIMIVLSVGLASLNAMPGNPLYSVKRTVEGVGLAVSSGHSKVNRRLSQAEKRMRELEYAQAHGMKSWLLPLLHDAENEIDEVRKEASELGSRFELDADKRAGDLVIEHEDSVREALPSIPVQERESVEKWLDNEKQEREQLDGEGAVPAPGTVETGSKPEGVGGHSYSPPREQESLGTAGSANVSDAAGSKPGEQDVPAAGSPEGGSPRDRE